MRVNQTCTTLFLLMILLAPLGVTYGSGLSVGTLPSDPVQHNFVCSSATGVIGTCASEPALQVDNMVWVGVNGTGDYTTIQAALDNVHSWCGTPGTNNLCLVQLGPGVHDVGSSSLQMLDYVHIRGKGIDATVITGSRTGTTGGVVNMASASLESLTVKNQTSASGSHIAVYAASGGARLRDVGMRCQNQYTCYGFYNNGAYSVKMERVDIVSSSSNNDTTDDAYGIYNVSGSFFDIRDSSINVSDAADRRYGIRNNGLITVTVRDTEITVGGQTSGATNSQHFGIYNFNSDIKLVAVDIKMSGGSSVFKAEGFHHGSSGGNDTAEIIRSNIYVNTPTSAYALHYSGTGTYEVSNSRLGSMGTSGGPSVSVVNSTISRGVLSTPSATHYCVSVYKTFPLVLLNANCQ